MFTSRAERAEKHVKHVAEKWLDKYRLAKLARMEVARLEFERGGFHSIGQAKTGSSRVSRLTSVTASVSSNPSTTNVTTNTAEGRKLHIVQEKLKTKVKKQKLKEKAERRKLVKKQQKLQDELEYINFPTIMGWYFDGFFTQPFLLNPKYAAVFNELEEAVAHKKEVSYKETFTEKTRRNFWPPFLIGSSFFRTRGVYMDLSETIKDPPHTPPQIDFEHIAPDEKYPMYLDPNNESFYGGDNSREPSRVKFTDEDHVQPYARKPQKNSLDEDDDSDDSDEDEDDDLAVPKVMRFGSKKKYQPIRSKMFYKIRREERLKKKHIRKTDFYFDDDKAEFYRKVPNDSSMYYYDLRCQVWRIKRTPMTFATDFYFDTVTGTFLPKDRSRRPGDYVFDKNFCCYKLGSQTGQPKNGLTPDDFVFDERIGKWRKSDSLSDEDKKEMKVDHNASRFAIKNYNLNPDDYFFNTEEGKYELKTGTDEDHEKYTYNTNVNAWVLTEISPDAPKSKMTPMYYFWDEKNFSFRRKNAPSAYFIYDDNNKFFRMKKSLKGKYNPKNWRWDDKNKVWYLQKSARSGYFSEDLHWRPERDYDKPWLEYIGGYVYYPRKDSFMEENDDGTRTDNDGNIINPSDGMQSGGAGKSEGPAPSPAIGRKIPQAVKIKEDPNRPSFSPAKVEALNKALEAHDTYDRRVLKIYGLGFVLTEADLRAFFISTYKILRPKIINSTVNDDFALLYFLTDEAAAAALKTMNRQKIKGVAVRLTYCKKEDRKIFEARVDDQVRQRRQSVYFHELNDGKN